MTEHIVDQFVSRLRTLARTGGDPLAVDRAQAGALADELSRLLQSANRLRSQNAKLRRRIERLKAGLGDEEVDERE